MESASVLVTGGCGFVGGHVVRHVIEKHPRCRVTVLDKTVSGIERNAAVNYFQVDITSAEQVEAFFYSQSVPFDVVFHIAGFCPPLAERYARRLDDLVFKVNVEGTQNMLHAAQSHQVRAFVYTSSICAVTDDFSQSYAFIDERWPVVERGRASSYGESKAAAEGFVLPASTSDFRTCAIRPTVVFGEGDQQLVPNVVNCIIHKTESPYRLGDGTNLWDSVYVGNVADAHVLAAENLLSDSPTAAGEAFFIINNEPVSSRDFMLQIWKEYNGHIPPFEVQIPLRLAWLIGYVSELYTRLTGSPATLSRGSVMDAVAVRYMNGAKAERLLGYRPRVGMEEGLRRTCQWLRAEHKQQLQSEK